MDHLTPTPEQHLTMSYMAYGDGWMRAYAPTPKAAALAFFAKYPTKRKPFNITLVQEHNTERGEVMTHHADNWPGWRNITKKNLDAAALPDVAFPETMRDALIERCAKSCIMVFHCPK